MVDPDKETPKNSLRTSTTPAGSKTPLRRTDGTSINDGDKTQLRRTDTSVVGGEKTPLRRTETSIVDGELHPADSFKARFQKVTNSNDNSKDENKQDFSQ